MKKILLTILFLISFQGFGMMPIKGFYGGWESPIKLYEIAYKDWRITSIIDLSKEFNDELEGDIVAEAYCFAEKNKSCNKLYLKLTTIGTQTAKWQDSIRGSEEKFSDILISGVKENLKLKNVELCNSIPKRYSRFRQY